MEFSDRLGGCEYFLGGVELRFTSKKDLVLCAQRVGKLGGGVHVWIVGSEDDSGIRFEDGVDGAVLSGGSGCNEAVGGGGVVDEGRV